MLQSGCLINFEVSLQPTVPFHARERHDDVIGDVQIEMGFNC